MLADRTYFINHSQVANSDDYNSSTLLNLFTQCNKILIDGDDGLLILTDQSNFSDVFAPNWVHNYNFFFDVILVGFVILAGVTGNVLSCLVLIRDRSHGTTSLLLTSLAICDTMFVLGCFFFQFLKTLAFYTLWLDYINLYAHISKFLYGNGTTVRMLRNWTVVLISLERWVAVCKPLHAPSICTRKKARLAIIFLTILCIIYCLPNFFLVDGEGLYCHGSQIDPSTKITLKGIVVYQSALRDWVKNNYLFQLLYRVIGYMVLIVFLPTMIIAILNVLLVRGIKYANARRAHIMAQIDSANRQCDSHNPNCPTPHDSYCRPENHAYFVRMEKSTRSRTGEVNRLCVGVIIIYLICELPAVGYQFIHLIQHREAIRIIRPVTNALVCANSGVNFFVYVLLGRRFRSQLRDMLRRVFCRCGKVSSNGHIVRSSFRQMNSPRAALSKDEDILNEIGSDDGQDKDKSKCCRVIDGCGERKKDKRKRNNWSMRQFSLHTQQTSATVV